jgi:hypothetical protein
MIVIRELVEIVAIHELDTEVLAASIRNPLHMTQAALAGAHVATIPFKVLQQMVHHPLTDKGIVQFRSDWDKARKALAAKEGKAPEDVKAHRGTRLVVDASVGGGASGGDGGGPRSVPGGRVVPDQRGTRRPRRTSSGSTTTCTSRIRSARCSSTSAAGG